MPSKNRAEILGHLGREPEVRFTGNGKAKCSFSVATTERWKDANGEKKENTTWHNVVCWGPLAENAGKWLKKGQLVLVEGRIDNRSYEKDGQKRYISEIVAQSTTTLYSIERSISRPRPEFVAADPDFWKAQGSAEEGAPEEVERPHPGCPLPVAGAGSRGGASPAKMNHAGPGPNTIHYSAGGRLLEW